jgi:hypothetical protein
METATITLQGSLSHTVRLANQPEIKFIKGRPYATSDAALIAYAKKQSAFSVTLNVMPKAVANSEPPPAPSTRTASGRFMKKQPVRREESEAEGSGE